jgi:hypothetical protein
MGQCCGELTFNSFLILNLASASGNWSGREVPCYLKTQPRVRPSDYNDLARNVGGDGQYGSGELFPQEPENGKPGHCKGVGADGWVTVNPSS